MKCFEAVNSIKNGELDGLLCSLYGKECLEAQKERYISAINSYEAAYGGEDISIFSVPGRSELSGNHTDHNRGCVIATSVDLDIVAVAGKSQDTKIAVTSQGYGEDIVDIGIYNSPDPALFGTSSSIIAGVAARMCELGYNVGGFSAYMTSNVLKGSGLSSSAAYENTVGTVISHLYNGGGIDNVEIAKISQYAENVFFGKPCGLMDQVACAVGGIVAIDFADKDEPVIEPISFDLSGAGYKLCIVNTGGNHADLTDDYASVPFEMKAVAGALGCEVLRETDEENVMKNLPMLRKIPGDRAVMRALHFFEENKRVCAQKQALRSGELDAYLSGVNASGISSFCYLQNVYTTKNLTEQGLSLALCLCESVLSRKNSAWRVHGGGFAGTIQAYVRECDIEKFKTSMDGCFGDGACGVLSVRLLGAVKVL